MKNLQEINSAGLTRDNELMLEFTDGSVILISAKSTETIISILKTVILEKIETFIKTL